MIKWCKLRSLGLFGHFWKFLGQLETKSAPESAFGPVIHRIRQGYLTRSRFILCIAASSQHHSPSLSIWYVPLARRTCMAAVVAAAADATLVSAGSATPPRLRQFNSNLPSIQRRVGQFLRDQTISRGFLHSLVVDCGSRIETVLYRLQHVASAAGNKYRKR